MKNDHLNCTVCDGLLVEVECALNRSWSNMLLTAFGSSELQIRLKGSRWMPFMNPGRNAQGLYCANCGSLTMAPSIPSQRRELGLNP